MFTLNDIKKSACGARNKTGYDFIIGIDCGVSTGICVYSVRRREINEICTVKIHAAMHKVRILALMYKCFVRIEDARLRKWIPKQKSEKAERGRREGAGSVKRDASIWQDFLTDIKVPFEMVAPKNNKTKVSSEYFKKLTKYEGVTSKHARDAGMLCYGF